MADGARSAPARVPPSNLEAEAAVLSACLLDESRAAIDESRALLNPGSFYADANRWVFDAILELDSEGKAPDVVLVAQRLRDRNRLEQVGGTPYLAQLADSTPAVAHVGQHAKLVADKGRQRRVIAELQRHYAEAYLEHEDVPTWALTVAQGLAEVAAVEPRDPPELFSEIVPRVLEETSARSRHGVVVSGVDTGWASFTQALGGWKRGKLHVVGGRPGMGKTAFVLGAALNVAMQGLGVIFESAEMSKEELVQRAIGVIAGVDVRKIETGRLNQQEWGSVTSACDVLRKLPLSVVFKPGATITEIRSTVRSEQRRLAQRGCKQLGLVIADYLQILDGERQHGEAREAEVARLSKGLTWLAGEFNVPVLGVSQLNRAVESRSNKSKRPTLSDLRESGAIEQDAYSVTLLYRDEYYDKASEWAGTVEAIIAKNRGGPTSTVRLAFIADSTRIASLEPQEEIFGYRQGGIETDEYDNRYDQ